MQQNKFFFAGFMVLAAVILAATSCKRVETEPKDWFGSELIFDTLDRNATLALANFYDLYNYIPGGFNRISGDFLGSGTDDAVPSRPSQPVEFYSNGAINVVNNPESSWERWDRSYAGIRRVNIFLKNIGRVPMRLVTSAPSDTVIRRNWRAEARFIRALLYFELVKRYGGVPLVGDSIFTYESNLELPRNTFEQCVNYIVSECRIIKDSLRSEIGTTAVPAFTDPEWGRIPRGAAVALKLRTFLYAASPLYNGGGVETDPAKKALAGYPTYEAWRWDSVLAAAEEFRALGYYGLYTSGTAPAPFMSVFTVKKNTEVILAKQAANNTSLETANSPVGYASASVTANGFTSPTQNFVDAFPMNTGLSIAEAGPAYNPQNPYANRDPRLTATVFFNGQRWLNRNVETFEGGRDKPNDIVRFPVQTRTGYYLRKFMGDFTNSTTFSNTSHNFIIFRYAEVLLNYAEALNEKNRVEDAVTQIKAIRARAGIAAGTNTRYGIKAGISQAEMRDLIRNERRIELAFEEHRFWDVRRWKIAEQVLNGSLYGMKINNNNGVFSYQKVEVGKMVFTPRLYHMPFPYEETLKNRNLVQNEGW